MFRKTPVETVITKPKITISTINLYEERQAGIKAANNRIESIISKTKEIFNTDEVEYRAGTYKVIWGSGFCKENKRSLVCDTPFFKIEDSWSLKDLHITVYNLPKDKAEEFAMFIAELDCKTNISLMIDVTFDETTTK